MQKICDRCDFKSEDVIEIDDRYVCSDIKACHIRHDEKVERQVNAPLPHNMTVQKLMDYLEQCHPQAIVSFRGDNGIYQNIKLRDNPKPSAVVLLVPNQGDPV